MNLQRFANPTPAPIPTPAPEPVKTKIPVEGTKTSESKSPEGKTFTQAEMDAHAQERAVRATKAGKEALIKELGFASVEELTAAAKAAKDAQEAAKTEAQKQTEALTAARKAVQDAEVAKTEALTKADQKVIKTEVRSLARTMGAVDIDMVQLALQAAGTEIKVDDEGNVTGAQEALDALKESKAYLFQAVSAAPPVKPPAGGSGANPGGQGAKTIDEQIAEAETQMLNEKDSSKRSFLAKQLTGLKREKMRGTK